ncbi:signal recognition particle-docking protein FtsY [Peptoniphilus sp. GNH]|nr:signal recognition particle-docking protein FtsY [Clostridiales bacterium KA00134]UHR03190.1 signal recognition particle-docking protein FtsY [Peptoniphilus sp. GNH]
MFKWFKNFKNKNKNENNADFEAYEKDYKDSEEFENESLEYPNENLEIFKEEESFENENDKTSSNEKVEDDKFDFQNEEEKIEEHLEILEDEDDEEDEENKEEKDCQDLKEEDFLQEDAKADEETSSTSEEKIENLQEEIEEPKKLGIFERLKQGLSKTRRDLSIKLNTVLGAYVKIDDELLEEIEDILISADIGMETTMELVDNLRQRIINEKVNDPQMVIPLLKDEMKKFMESCDKSNELKLEPSPALILVIGVNGVGKTTTIGKLANKLKKKGKKVALVAADTFRAAAIDQLKTWADRVGVDIIANKEGSDPASVIYDGISAAKSRKVDVLICDTAGRLHNKNNLMQELEKINRIIEREFPQATRETILVLDATTGQNAIIQAKTFKEVADISAIALTKLDGTAKGGVVLGLQGHHKIPIKLIGVGEGIDDLQDFKTEEFIEAIFD